MTARHALLSTLAVFSLAAAQAPLPPGFLDEAPPLPTSDTVILSGGTLVLTPAIADAVVVITDGVVQAWGKRGEVDVPSDSVGRDMRGKWLVPKGSLAAGKTAAFTLYDGPPSAGDSRVVGSVDHDAIVVEADD